MTKKVLTCLATVFFLIGSVGITAAAGRDNGMDFCSEGKVYKRDCGEGQIVRTKLRRIDQEGSLYVEGMGFANRADERKTVLPTIADNQRDFGVEGFSYEEFELMKILKMTEEMAPAAGNNSLFMELMKPRVSVLDFIE